MAGRLSSRRNIPRCDNDAVSPNSHSAEKILALIVVMTLYCDLSSQSKHFLIGQHVD
jgi:hypothetical protein